MSEIQVEDRVTHRYWGKDEYLVRGIDGEQAWIKDTAGLCHTVALENLTKVEPKFEPGKTYQFTGYTRYRCVGVASNGRAYGYSYPKGRPDETEAWVSGYKRDQYSEVRS